MSGLMKRRSLLWLVVFILLTGIVSLVVGWWSWQKYRVSNDPAKALTLIAQKSPLVFADDLPLDSMKQALDRNLAFLAGRDPEMVTHFGSESFSARQILASQQQLRQFIDRIRTASYGYAGIFDAIKIKQEELVRVYEYDYALLALSGDVSTAIDNVETSIGTEGLDAAIRNLTGVSQQCVDAFNKRSEVMKGIVPEE